MKKILVSLALFSASLFGDEVYAIFNVKAVQDANLTLNAIGTIDSIFVDVDSVVKEGDILLNLQNTDKTAQVAAIEQQFNFAKKQYERYKRSGDVIDKNTLDNYLANYKKLEADYMYYKIQYENTILRAPFDGTIAEKKVEKGDGVVSNNTILFRIVSNNKKIVLQFDSKYLNKVKVGDLFEYQIDGQGASKSATITKIYPTIDEKTRKITAEAATESSMKPGLFGDGFIKTRE